MESSIIEHYSNKATATTVAEEPNGGQSEADVLFSSEASPLDRRQLVNTIVRQGNLGIIVDAIMRATEQLVGEERATSDLLGEVKATVQGLLDEGDHDLPLAIARASSMLRYLMEDGSYVGDTITLDHLMKEGFLEDEMAFMDLGAGSGDAVHKWASRGNPAFGVDLSPSFIGDHARLGRMGTMEFGVIDGNPHLLGRHLDTLMRTNHTRVLIHSSLTLDRVGKPKGLVDNMKYLAGERGSIALFTLLPVIPRDDENVENPIEYTPKEHRLTETGSVGGDMRNIIDSLQSTRDSVIRVLHFPYTVQTSTGTRTYNNYFGFISAPSS